MNSIRPYRQGDTLRADRMNELVKAHNERIPGVAPAVRYARPVARGDAAQVRLVTLVEAGEDFLLCTITRGSQEGEYLFVAKPPYLRQSTVAHAGLTFVHTAANARTATDGVDSEDQELVPPYTVGDELLVIGPCSTGVVDTEDREIQWLDVNVWARMWGVVPE